MSHNMKDHKITVRFTESEYKTIRRRMETAGIINQSAFVRAIVLNGYVLKLDFPEIREMIQRLGYMNNNINQIAKRENSGGHIYETELYEIQENQQEIWNQQRKILEKLTKIT